MKDRRMKKGSTKEVDEKERERGEGDKMKTSE